MCVSDDRNEVAVDDVAGNAPVPLAGDATALAWRTKKIADALLIRHMLPRIFIYAVDSSNVRSGVAEVR